MYSFRSTAGVAGQAAGQARPSTPDRLLLTRETVVAMPNCQTCSFGFTTRGPGAQAELIMTWECYEVYRAAS